MLNAKALAAGIDPAAQKKTAKRQLAQKHEHTFKAVAEAWHKRESKRWAPSHADRIWRDLKRDLLPELGDTPVADIKTPTLLRVVKKIEERGAVDVASRAQQRIGALLTQAHLDR